MEEAEQTFGDGMSTTFGFGSSLVVSAVAVAAAAAVVRGLDTVAAEPFFELEPRVEPELQLDWAPVPLRCSALQRILIEFSVRPGSRPAIWLHLFPSRA